MGKFKFDGTPPIRSEMVKIEEWDPEETFVIWQLRADECKELLDMAFSMPDPDDNNPSKNIPIYAETLSRCLTTESGEKPTKEWLLKAGLDVLKRLFGIAARLNNMTAEAREEAEKN